MGWAGRRVGVGWGNLFFKFDNTFQKNKLFFGGWGGGGVVGGGGMGSGVINK